MTDRGIEEQRLMKTLAAAKVQIEQAWAAIEGKESDLADAKREVRENATHSVGNYYSSDGFEALVELSQTMNPVTELVLDMEEEKRKIARLERLLKKPYFARVDFRFQGEEAAEEVYIGRTSLMERSTREMYVYDWRSPIASVFYRFMTGEAFYEAPGGRMDGEVTKKRQYEIMDGILKFYFDADRNINDEFLRQMLSQNASPQMKAIVETIQAEQDVIIRDMERDLLMVQGVAGSGKTSIALHRAAYLMYQGLKNKLSANNILIISPNDTFEQYIANVLPELGEENAESATFEELMAKLLRDKKIQSKNDFLEELVTGSPMVRASVEYKTSEQFLERVDAFVEDMALRWIDFEDIDYNGRHIAGRKTLQEWVLRRGNVPLGIRLIQLEDYILELIFGSVKRRSDAEERNRVRQALGRFTRPDIAVLYEKLTGANEAEQIRYEDAIVMMYLHLKLYGSQKYKAIRQVVIDEAQDYYPMQYVVFRMLFPNAKFTVLGDVNQTLSKSADMSLYEQIPHYLKKQNAPVITLNKSFRCTNEILEFAMRYVEHRPEIVSFNRRGEVPREITPEGQEELWADMEKEIRECIRKGYETICILCKDRAETVRIYRVLKKKIPTLQMTDHRKKVLQQGVFVMPVYQSKGLEFDAVLIYHGSDPEAEAEAGRRLMYVASTRALHRLIVFHRNGLQ